MITLVRPPESKDEMHSLMLLDIDSVTDLVKILIPEMSADAVMEFIAVAVVEATQAKEAIKAAGGIEKFLRNTIFDRDQLEESLAMAKKLMDGIDRFLESFKEEQDKILEMLIQDPDKKSVSILDLLSKAVALYKQVTSGELGSKK